MHFVQNPIYTVRNPAFRVQNQISQIAMTVRFRNSQWKDRVDQFEHCYYNHVMIQGFPLPFVSKRRGDGPLPLPFVSKRRGDGSALLPFVSTKRRSYGSEFAIQLLFGFYPYIHFCGKIAE